VVRIKEGKWLITILSFRELLIPGWGGEIKGKIQVPVFLDKRNAVPSAGNQGEERGGGSAAFPFLSLKWPGGKRKANLITSVQNM